MHARKNQEQKAILKEINTGGNPKLKTLFNSK